MVYEGHDESGHHTLSVLGRGESTGRVIYTGGTAWFDLPVQVVWRTRWMGIEVPGYVPVFPNAQVFLGDEDLATYGDLPRVLVPLDSGEVLDDPDTLVEIAEWESAEARLAHMQASASTGVYAPLAGMLAAPFRATVIRELP